MIGTDWFDGVAPISLPCAGTPAEAALARTYCARLVSRAAKAGTLPPECPPVPRWEVGSDAPPRVPDRSVLSLSGQWLAYLYDYLGLWPPER